MSTPVPHTRLYPSRPFTIIVKRRSLLVPALVLMGLALFGGWWSTVHASPQGAGASAIVADSGTGRITGYIVGSGDVSAYACPDVNTAKCPIRLTLHPGTTVQIIDNVIGSNVPGLNDNTWRKILYQGQTLFVPLHFISINPSGNGSGPDVSLVQTSFEDDSTTPPPTGGFLVAPGSTVLSHQGFPPRPYCTTPGQVMLNDHVCCPPGFTFVSLTPRTNGNPLQVHCQQPLPTWYIATDGRIGGNAGDRIAIYCRKSGRIEVWSINDSQGHFLVSFNHVAIDTAANKSFSVSIGAQGTVTVGGDGHGLYWAAIHGGSFNATGAGDFAKIFHCYTTP